MKNRETEHHRIEDLRCDPGLATNAKVGIQHVPLLKSISKSKKLNKAWLENLEFQSHLRWNFQLPLVLGSND